MSVASNYLEDKIGSYLLRTLASWTKPTGIWVALFTVLPAEDGTGGTEVSTSATGYGRVQHGPSDATWSAPTNGNGQFSNIGVIEFGEPTDNWGEIVGFGLYDAETSGNLLVLAALSASVTINDGDPPPAFAEGALLITIS